MEELREIVCDGDIGLTPCAEKVSEISDRNSAGKELLLEKMKEQFTQGLSGISFSNITPEILADYVEAKHHPYFRKRVEQINNSLDKLCKMHGQQHAELFEFRRMFLSSGGKLLIQLNKEELILLPLIRKKAKQIKPDLIALPIDETTLMKNALHAENDFGALDKLSIPSEEYKGLLQQVTQFRTKLKFHLQLMYHVLLPSFAE